jgi:soluble lytic murein transglycosylase-like protein
MTGLRPSAIHRPAVRAALLLGLLVVWFGALAGPASAHATTVTVAPGDSLSAIAARHGVSVAALAAANGITDPDRIVAGRVLRLPGATSTGAASASGAPAGRTYRVRPGDSLGAIASRYGVSVRALAAANGIRNANLVVAGRVLRIPGAGSSSGAAHPVATSRSEVGSMLNAAAARHGVDPALARAVAWQESGWNQSVVSSAGAVGVMQLMPGTARWLGRDVLGRPLDRHSTSDNIDGGVAFLAWLLRRTGDTRTAVAAYYQGLESVRTRGLYDDTSAYVRSVLALRGRV